MAFEIVVLVVAPKWFNRTDILGETNKKRARIKIQPFIKSNILWKTETKIQGQFSWILTWLTY